MTHEDAGNYAAKRQGIELDETISANIKERAIDNKISCADAHAIAVNLKADPAVVGAAIDLLEIRINRCQLGLFGYVEKKNFPEITGPVNPEMEFAVKSLVVNERITCLAAWETAKRFSVSRAMISAVCEKMKIKISKCQLGTFK